MVKRLLQEASLWGTIHPNQSFSSGRWTLNNRGNKVIFDHTTGTEAMETPLSNDYLASNIPPVGGFLRSFRRDWLKEKCSNNLLNINTNGYVLPFITKPKLARHPLILSGYKVHQKDQALASGIQSLLSKSTKKHRKLEVSWVLQFPVCSWFTHRSQIY